MHEIPKFAIPDMRSFVPEKLRPWIVILFMIIFQLSGAGIYMAASVEMAGATALMQQDILMIGYASMAGMALTFALMFRLKFRYTTFQAFMICCSVIIVGNIICMYSKCVPLMVIVSFIAGFFRMWGIFTCNSSVQLWITPKRDMSIFFCYIYLQVQMGIQLSGLMTMHIAHHAMWEYMHYAIIALLLLVMLTVLCIYHNWRVMPKLQLYGVDWLGALLWGGVMLCVIFVCVYGDYYDWYDSSEIRIASGAALLMVGLNLWRASFIRHPFIGLKTWSQKPIYLTMLLYLVVDLLIAPSHMFEHMYVEAILGYDALHAVSLNWFALAGSVVGAIFTYFTFAKNKWRYRVMSLIGFTLIVLYLVIFYFLIDYNLPKEAFILPIFLRGFGYVVIAIVFLTALTKIPFNIFFQTVSMQGWISAACGGVIGTAILGEWFQKTVAKNSMLLTANMDALNTQVNPMNYGKIYGASQLQAMLLSMKEIYGWLTILGVLCIALFLFHQSSLRPKSIHPKYFIIWKAIRSEVSRVKS
ncbi:MAG: hypothetical protein E7071_00790 [Bacteroidales bacterium]|nr:hypothetical protein [Bacteroidales bacterium]